MKGGAGPLGVGDHKLCDSCAKDTAVKGRCPRKARIDRPGTICDRCLSDGKLLVLYRVCCEPERRYGHTEPCKKASLKAGSPALQRAAAALFSTDPRVLTLLGKTFGDGLWTHRDSDPELSTCIALAKQGRIQRLGAAWELAGHGHEPEATYRKEAEERVFMMGQFERELDAFKASEKEAARLTRESKATPAKLLSLKELTKDWQPPPVLPQAVHQENVRLFQESEVAKRTALASKRSAEMQSDAKYHVKGCSECGVRMERGSGKTYCHTGESGADFLQCSKACHNSRTLKIEQAKLLSLRELQR